MRLVKISIAAVLVLAPALLGAVPAEALTANQYMHQGHGRYTNSSGTRVSGPGARYHRYYRHQRFRHRHHRG